MNDATVKDGCIRPPIKLEVERPVERAKSERLARGWYGLRTNGRVMPINGLGWDALRIHIGSSTPRDR